MKSQTSESTPIITFSFLSTESDLDKWLDFVHSIFRPKATREYFLAHHLNDPKAKASDIVIAKLDNEIVGTVKVFHRSIQVLDSTNGKQGEKVVNNNEEINNDEELEKPSIGMCSCKGIGEVGTRSDFRGRGIASSLLNLQVDKMKSNHDNDAIILSSLHASTDASKLYGKLGWSAIPLHFSKLKFALSKPTCSAQVGNKVVRIEVTNFKNENLHVLYENYCRYFGFLGVEIRSEEYWNRWVVHESKTHQCNSYALYENDELKAYIIVGPDDKNECLKVKEFICDYSENSEKRLEYFFKLIDHAQSETIVELSQISAILPRPVAKFVFNLSGKIGQSLQGLTHAGILEEYQEFWWTDNGYMYNLVKKPHEKSTLTDLIEEEKHVVWKTDGF
ncbi:GCN5-related N-acetyltransferase [Naegleria gruberi]|uniref:GCN5-related N-acetyltransferase n=1 Tax=Naegleria gruberi TaxID=5762 RepID=D2VHY3_NAEGR|nr:GCN5-related N-acetyltransferase [Naegleria gruberi]EFC43420.1 GCN5-related N-acetyltransferase [Naegleria gruberi]|eukprot:XP_002676164.1 GCN5-related N-acetyltransferase [Naegleria gruberi strain NEG-M]